MCVCLVLLTLWGPHVLTRIAIYQILLHCGDIWIAHIRKLVILCYFIFFIIKDIVRVKVLFGKVVI